ncbi:L,D-transpeptidase [Roseiarcaceae bacterium H3SJ34-1]|uniref:L,D-transpeptidase n=1 Tax=Terripilifer ovatus TaxID=3032367 RepID=UPI003AB91A8A|nr:L,D-transpeptidase [Roseiarcaceae bacterium H3SJ34-1]
MTRACTSSLRSFLLLAAASGLTGCTAHQETPTARAALVNAHYSALYQAEPDERCPLHATDISAVDEQYLRREVAYDIREQPGTIMDTADRHLYLVRENGRAIRYGIGVGADGMKWSGRAVVGRKAAWPRWTPTASMIKRDPERNAPWAKGMTPGLANPLGPCALYLYQNGRDTLYRIHGTNEPHTIGEAVSSGHPHAQSDILDLYRRTPTGAAVVVLADAPRPTLEARSAPVSPAM